MGLDWSKIKVTVGPCGRVRCEPGWRLDRQWSANLRDFDLWLVWAGRGRMQLRERAIDLRPGACLWARPGGLYLGEQDRTDRLGVTFIHFDMRDMRGRRVAERDLPAEMQEVDDLHLFDAVTRRVVEQMQAQPPATAAAANWLRALLMDWDRAGRAGGTGPRGVTRQQYRQMTTLMARIREQPAEVPPVAELARQAGYSVGHFARLFKQVAGRGPEAFIIHARVARARQLLRETEWPVGAVAEALGYGDPYFFSRQFKQQTGLTPLAFRRGADDDFPV